MLTWRLGPSLHEWCISFPNKPYIQVEKTTLHTCPSRAFTGHCFKAKTTWSSSFSVKDYSCLHHLTMFTEKLLQLSIIRTPGKVTNIDSERRPTKCTGRAFLGCSFRSSPIDLTVKSLPFKSYSHDKNTKTSNQHNSQNMLQMLLNRWYIMKHLSAIHIWLYLLDEVLQQ